MARKEIYYTVEDKGRDNGKCFFIREMSATEAEWWAIRAGLAMAKNGVNLPDNFSDMGMAGMAKVGFEMVAQIPPADARPLLDELMACVMAVLISTQGGSLSVQSTPGSVINIRCDGTNIYQVQPSLFNETGYQYLDSGLIIQWGVVGVNPGATISVTYPKPFQVGAFIGLASKGALITTKDYSCGIDAGKSSALIINGENVSGGTTAQGIRWFVIGY